MGGEVLQWRISKISPQLTRLSVTLEGFSEQILGIEAHISLDKAYCHESRSCHVGSSREKESTPK